MKHKIRVTQVLRITKTTVIAVEADSVEHAIEALHHGEIDLPSASNDVGSVWVIEHSALVSEDYAPAGDDAPVASSC